MKFEFNEGDYGAGFNLIAETPEECAQLLRIATNCKAEKPAIRLFFEAKEITFNIWMRKVKKNVQRSSIAPFNAPSV